MSDKEKRIIVVPDGHNIEVTIYNKKDRRLMHSLLFIGFLIYMFKDVIL